jgi:hypothetical protein
MMLTEDYLLRMINQAVAVLLQVLGLKKNGEYLEAHQAIEGALDGLLGMRPDLARLLEEGQILEMLTVQDQLDTGRLAVIADLYLEDGEALALLGREAESRFAYTRALRFQMEIALAEMDRLSSEQVGKVEAAAQKLAGQPLPVETQLARLDYLEALLAKDSPWLASAGLERHAVSAEYGRLREGLKPYLQ